MVWSSPLSASGAEAAAALAQADALLVTAGAGMSVDSGLPDFRSPDGFWRAYPPLRALGVSFAEMAQPHWFESAPEIAWAWYGHRQLLYRSASPHAGYALLRKWGAGLAGGMFVITSNVDGQFVAAGFDPGTLLEVHGGIFRLQCTVPCSDTVWELDRPEFEIDLAALRAIGRLPQCPACGAMARPNVLMFEDAAWVRTVRGQQEARCTAWLQSIHGRRLVIIECGAGVAIPTIRMIGERLARDAPAALIRINPGIEYEEEGEAEALTIRLPALQALTAIDAALSHPHRPPSSGTPR